MAKEKSSKDASAKKEKKEKKRSEEDGVHKKSKDKKEKKQKSEVLTTKVQNVLENGEQTGAPVEAETKVEKVEKPRLVGALVPFANPLADDKVAKKVFKGVKKGKCILPELYADPILIDVNQLPHPKPSSEESKKSSKPFANLPTSLQLSKPHPILQELSSWPQISLLWM